MNRTENKGQMDRSDIHIDWASWKLEQIIQANKKTYPEALRITGWYKYYMNFTLICKHHNSKVIIPQQVPP